VGLGFAAGSHRAQCLRAPPDHPARRRRRAAALTRSGQWWRLPDEAVAAAVRAAHLAAWATPADYRRFAEHHAERGDVQRAFAFTLAAVLREAVELPPEYLLAQVLAWVGL
jgi:hypothetical protein